MNVYMTFITTVLLDNNIPSTHAILRTIAAMTIAINWEIYILSLSNLFFNLLIRFFSKTNLPTQYVQNSEKKTIYDIYKGNEF